MGRFNSDRRISELAAEVRNYYFQLLEMEGTITRPGYQEGTKTTPYHYPIVWNTVLFAL